MVVTAPCSTPLTFLRRRKDHPWQPWLAPTCGGRTNTSALDIGSDPDPVQGLSNLLEKVAAGRLSELVTERPVVRVEIEEGTFYGMFLGFGMLHRAVQLVHQGFPDGKARGTFGAGLLTATLVARAVVQRETGGLMTPDAIDFTIDGEAYGSRTLRLAMVSTLRRLFFGLVPFWGKEEAPLQMTFIETTVRHAPWVVASILARRPGRLNTPENGCHSHNVHQLDLQLDVGLILDGELFDPIPGRRVRITADENVRWLRA